ncbi:DUF4238 domain-containing protein [Arthrobacter sp. MA-N2]|uniref:DUF4238 domain-containing protein n=1 Tax=Arthrobacter sp. MA-N2 TaxID=1101188 RepID=UPI0012DD0AB4|nr:DUF4238 domain-containing protein [Arthrobacter sp. MA-N2]
MSLHHYLPAVYMGGFSLSDDGSRRYRPLWCLRRGSQEPFPTTGDKLGSAKDLYTLKKNWQPQSLDRVWAYYEKTLPSAISQLVDTARPLEANTWLRTLVPFVASLFVRGPEFNERFGSRIPARLQRAGSEDSTNGARVIELQRLLAQVAAAHWGVVTSNDPQANFITNEIGLSVARVSGFESTHGWLVPLDRRHVLTVTPRRSGQIMTHSGLGWKTIIGRRGAGQDEVKTINRNTAGMAREFVIAGEQQFLKSLNGKWQRPPDRTWLDGGWGCTSEERIAHEFDWHRLVSVAARPYSPDADLQSIDKDIWAAEWCPPPFFPTNLPEFRSGLHLKERTISLDLGPRKGFPRREEHTNNAATL